MAKNGNGFWGKVKIILIIIGMAGTVLVGYGMLCSQVATNKEDIKEVVPRVQTNAENIKNVEGKLEYIKDGIDDIKLELRER